MKLSQLSPTDLATLLQNRTPATFEAEDDIFPVQGVTAAALGQPLTQEFEVPPSGLSRELLVAVLAHTTDDLRGRWLRLVAIVYWNNGRVRYRQLSHGAFEASITY